MAGPGAGVRASPMSSNTALFPLGVAVIALHVVDDDFLQPQPGTPRPATASSAGWCHRRCSGLAAWSCPRLEQVRRDALALFLAALAIADESGRSSAAR